MSDPKIGRVTPKYDVSHTPEVPAVCLSSAGEDAAGIQEEMAHHLRFQTGTVHGAGKRIDGFRREPIHGELLDVEGTGIEGHGTSQETE